MTSSEGTYRCIAAFCTISRSVQYNTKDHLSHSGLRSGDHEYMHNIECQSICRGVNVDQYEVLNDNL